MAKNKNEIRSAKKTVFLLKSDHLREGYFDDPNSNYKGSIRITDSSGTTVKADIVRGLNDAIRSGLEITLRSKTNLDPIVETLKVITKMLEKPEVYV